MSAPGSSLDSSTTGTPCAASSATPTSSAANPGRTGWRRCAATWPIRRRWPPRARASTPCSTWSTRWTGRSSSNATAARRPLSPRPQRDVRRIVYLGGLQPSGPRNSAHLASRREVGEILLAGRAPTAVLQAGIVVGAGSASFGMIRALAGSGPVLMLPDRAWNHTQPIAIDDVLHHLTACLALPPAVNGDLRHRRPGRADVRRAGGGMRGGRRACRGRCWCPSRCRRRG